MKEVEHIIHGSWYANKKILKKSFEISHINEKRVHAIYMGKLIQHTASNLVLMVQKMYSVFQ